jgi:hypothetical protein
MNQINLFGFRSYKEILPYPGEPFLTSIGFRAGWKGT